jgi:hypothetical protein
MMTEEKEAPQDDIGKGRPLRRGKRKAPRRGLKFDYSMA